VYFLALLLTLRAKGSGQFPPLKGVLDAFVPLLQALSDKIPPPWNEQITATLLKSNQRHALIRLTCFGKKVDPLVATVLQALAPGSVFTFSQWGYEVESVNLTDPVWTGVSTWPDMLSEQPGGRMRLTFATPLVTAHQEQGQVGTALPFPDPQTLFSSVFRRWQQCDGPPLPYPGEQAVQAARCVVTRYRLWTVERTVAGSSRLGYLGWLEYTCRTRDLAPVASLNALARLAFFTGSGYLTEHGLGVTRIAIGK
jgi:CRISPR/Cas system endoribonuclease Cas6 (RAMP superfamily)